MTVVPEPGVAYVEATWRTRTKALVAFAAFIGWLWSHSLWVPGLVDRLDQGAPCDSLGELQFLVAYTLFVVSLPPIVFGWRAWRTWRSGQVPPPGTWVLFRWRIRTGNRARIDAIGLLVVALLFAYIPVEIWTEIDGLEIFLDHGCPSPDAIPTETSR